MLKIDASLLQEIGLGTLPDAEKNSLLRHIYETLEMRVGIRLADQMSNEQLDEFERYFEAKDDAGAFKWLETNFPNYKDIVQEEFDKLKAEVAQSAPQILSASHNQPSPQAGAPAQLDPNQPQAPAQPYQPQDQSFAQQAPISPQSFDPQSQTAPAHSDNTSSPVSAPMAQPDPFQSQAQVTPMPQQPYQPNAQPLAPQQSADPIAYDPAPMNSPTPFQQPMPPQQPVSSEPSQNQAQPPYPSQQPPAGPTPYSDSSTNSAQ
jgi:hypothetical protein